MTNVTGEPPSTTDRPEGGDIFNDPVFLRNLKAAVVVMAVILILGFVAILGRIFYLSSRSSAQPPPSQAAGTAAPGRTALQPRVRLELPRDAAIRTMSLSGSQVAVQYEAPGSQGIAIVDLETGRTLSRIEIAPEPAR